MATHRFTGESVEQIEARKRRETAQRVKTLSIVAAVALVARLAIKDPPKPPPPDHSNVPIKILPGMLEALPASERAKLDPSIVAKMMEADAKARIEKEAKTNAQQSEVAYRPLPVSDDANRLREEKLQELYSYAKRQRSEDLERQRLKEEQESIYKMVVQFRDGGYLKVLDAREEMAGITVRIPGIAITVPREMVVSVVAVADWKEPVPTGKVRLQPARGITIVIDKGAAQRISLPKPGYHEI
jgi:hypothetical protein